MPAPVHGGAEARTEAGRAGAAQNLVTGDHGGDGAGRVLLRLRGKAR